MQMKEYLRKEVMRKRKNLSTTNVLEKSNRIKQRLFEMDEFRNAESVLFYVSYDNEVYTHEMIKESLSIGKEVVVPKSDTTNNTLLLSVITDWNDLERGAYDILEPKKQSIKKIDVESIDLILVPGVVFDIHGNRIGHGMGYYDRLLKAPHHISSIGLAFEFQIVNKISAEKHDIKVDKIVTEERIIDCRK
jgi:5-formyltetrahydrofolate cyclo-ligase